MFATLLGSLPRPPLAAGATPEELLRAVVQAQEAAGLEPIVDGGFGIGEAPVDRWRATAALTDRPVKQAVLGPYSAGPDATVRLHDDLLALAAGGCPLIEVHEPAATRIGTSEVERGRFRDAHATLLDGVAGTHLSLAIAGGSAAAAGVETLLAAPYASLAVDLIDGPDNWALVVRAPGQCGIVVGALSPRAGSDDAPELLLWAAGYAASTGGRGHRRVGIATASSLAHLSWPQALAKLARLGEAARVADLALDERLHALDPRSLDARSAALGRYSPRLPRPPHAARRDD